MSNKEINNSEIDSDLTYVIEDEVIDDTKCPKCNEKINDNIEFCNCGFYIQAANNSRKASILFLSIIIVVIVTLFLTQTNLLPSIGEKAAHKINEKKMSSFASPVMQVENKIKNTGLKNMIGNMYEKDIHNKNILIVVVKPEVWPTMKPEARKYVLKTLENFWKECYKGEDPQVKFANPGSI
ncbi:MAG: zinc ribbon domain-containing protein [Vampirovibrionia bacterium]